MNDPLYHDYLYDLALDRWYDESIEEFKSAMEDSVKSDISDDEESFLDLCDCVATCAFNFSECGYFMKHHGLTEAHALCWLFHRYHAVYSWAKVKDEFDKIVDSRLASCF